jgi:tripartite-type tricarboxylate transporter receptor subunit TctC
MERRMKLGRHHIRECMLLAVCLLLGASPAGAQGYPERPVRLLVPFAPGGNADILARIIGQRMTDALGRQIVVENRAGANGVLAPAGTPQAIVTRLNAVLVQIIRSPEVADRIKGMGADPATSTPAEFSAFIADEIAKWGRIIKAAGVRLD